MSEIIKKRNKWAFGFLILEAAIYLLFLWMDIFRPELYFFSSVLKFTGIVLCFFAVSSDTVLALALLLTVAADFSLLLSGWHFAGVLIFIVVQAMYAVLLNRISRKYAWLYFPVMAIAFSMAVMKAEGPGLLMAAAALYAAGIAGNAVRAALYIAGGKIQGRGRILFCMGLILFFFCDLSVGVFNLNQYGVALPAELFRISGIAMWFFYLPSQVLIALSAGEWNCDR